MLAFTMAHVSVIMLRFREPDRPSALPDAALDPARQGLAADPGRCSGAVMGLAAWVSVLVLHEGARVAGGGWMAFGILMFVVYRKTQGKSLAKPLRDLRAVAQDEPDAGVRLDPRAGVRGQDR